MTKHAYLPTTLISDKGTAFTSHVIKEVAGVLGVTLKHATTKHAQTIGLLERSHASIKKALKIEKGERRSLWHKYVNIAVLNYNTSYHASIGCEPSRVFHGTIPYNILDLKLGIRPQQQPIPTSQIAQDILKQTEMIHQDVRKNTMQACIKYKAYYDKKSQRFKTQRSRLCIYLAAKSGSLREQNSIHRTSMGWPVYCRESATKQQLSGTQNWHKQDAIAAPNENVSIHTPPTTSRHHSKAARI